MTATGGPAPALRGVFVRYAVAWFYLAGVSAAELGYVLLPQPDRAELLRWASTSVHNLTHYPAACLIASAFFPTSYLLAWPALIALALFGAVSVLGTWRAAVTCAAGQILGTVVSEGIIAYRCSLSERGYQASDLLCGPVQGLAGGREDCRYAPWWRRV